MPDETCGAECVDGTECQHPAGSCPVPSHSDSDAENPHGRDFALTEGDHEAILEAARDGRSKAGCARAAGVQKQNLQRYLDADTNADFRDAFARARAQGESELIEAGLYDDDADSSMAKFLLSTSFDYVKTEERKHEHSGPDGDPIQTEVVIGGSDE